MGKLKVVSLFTGCGGLDLGFKFAGFETVYASDNWNVACNTFKHNNPNTEVVCKDVREINFREIREKYGDIDCLIGGPPCPPYSQTRHYLVGKKSGFEDEKAGFAVPEFFRAIDEIRPKVFMFENVDGFMFKTHKEAFEFVQEKSKELGYNISYKVINCANYGVPQTRKRFICVGVLGSYQEFKFPEYTHAEKPTDKLLPWVTCGDILKDYDNITEEEKTQRPGGKDYEKLIQIPAGDNYLFFTEKRGCKNPLYKWKSRYWTFLLKLTPERPSWTIQASFSENQGPFHWKNRFLRIEEIKRIQTIPDDYEILGDFKEKWRQVGNAVPVLAAQKIAEAIKEEIFDGKK